MLYDKETRGREQQTNSLRFTLVHPSYSSLSLSFSRVIRTMREKKKKKLVLRLLVQVYIYIYIYSIRVFKDDSGVVYPGNKGVIPAEAGSRGGRCRVGSA